MEEKEEQQVDDGNMEGMVSLDKKEFRLIHAPFPAPPLIARMWDLWILYAREYRTFCLQFYGGLLVRHHDTSRESFEAY